MVPKKTSSQSLGCARPISAAAAGYGNVKSTAAAIKIQSSPPSQGAPSHAAKVIAIATGRRRRRRARATTAVPWSDPSPQSGTARKRNYEHTERERVCRGEKQNNDCQIG